ncbi:membrane-spanning 4-domains subfamily A member 8-like [Gastrophryne carolinensis]
MRWLFSVGAWVLRVPTVIFLKGRKMANKDDSPSYWNAPPGAPGYNVPQNVQMWNVPAQQGNFAAPQPGNAPVTIIPAMAQSQAFHQKFLEGKPKALGIVLIIVGILHIGLGIGLGFTASATAFISGIPFWGAVFYIVAGSLSIAAVNKPSMCLIQGSLGLSIVISIFSVLGIILNIVDYFVYYYCYSYDDYCYGVITGGHVIRGIFILSYLLLFSVSISLSVFGCRAIKHPPPMAVSQFVSYELRSFVFQVFVVQNPAGAQQPPVFSGPYPAIPNQPPAHHPNMAQGGPTA